MKDQVNSFSTAKTSVDVYGGDKLMGLFGIFGCNHEWTTESRVGTDTGGWGVTKKTKTYCKKCGKTKR